MSGKGSGLSVNQSGFSFMEMSPLVTFFFDIDTGTISIMRPVLHSAVTRQVPSLWILHGSFIVLFTAVCCTSLHDFVQLKQVMLYFCFYSIFVQHFISHAAVRYVLDVCNFMTVSCDFRDEVE